MKYLFLDDMRDPEHVSLYCPSDLVGMYNSCLWTTVRNYDDFIASIKKEFPHVVSFDHDLGDDIAQYRVKSGLYSKRKARAMKKEERSGMDCAKWLVIYCIYTGLELPKWYVHSQNPTGKENIEKYLENCEKSIKH